MRKTARRLALVALVALVFLVLPVRTDRDVVVAQTGQTITVTRIYTGPDGQSHAEELQMKLNGRTSELMKATGMQFSRTPAGYFNDWHVGPRRQFVITLSGRGEIEVAGGKKISMGPGHINLIEDLTGKGHTTRVVGTDDRVTVAIPLVDQAVK
jgi:quercetin dioxygenase-like cupin family protein